MGLGKLDLALLVLSLLASLAIGVYYSITGRKATPLEYLLGGRSMSPLPLSLSMMVASVSAITIMGNAGEIYGYGTQLWVMDVGILVCFVFIAKTFVPVFHPLQLVSIYQYIELRYHSRGLRQGTVMLQLVGGYLFLGFLIFPPSIVLQRMTGLSPYLNIVIIGLICTLYSTFGGVKAVVYADSLQACVMVVGVAAIVAQGAANYGLATVLDTAYHHGRIEFFNMDLNPYQRHSFWLCLTLGVFFALSNNGFNQSQTQRYFSTKTVAEAQRVLYYAAFAFLLLRGLIHLSGLVMYVHYLHCDPVTRYKQDVSAIPVFYVMDELTKIPGLTGLFVAAVYAAVLSSVSTQVNSMTALLWEDFLKVFKVFQDWTEVKIGYLQKLIVFCSGILGIVLSMVVLQFGWSFLNTVLAINGALTGPLIGLFLVAVFLPWVTAKGAAAGFILSLIISVTIVVGQLSLPKPPYLPLSTDGCDTTTTAATGAATVYYNTTTITTTITTTTTTTIEDLVNTTTTTTAATTNSTSNESVSWLFGMSYCLNSVWGSLVFVLISLVTTAITGCNKPDDLEERLISPQIWRLFDRGGGGGGGGGRYEEAAMEPLNGGNADVKERMEEKCAV